jgi:uncharacterized NAD(P)/FAD-binding protein YdhS
MQNIQGRLLELVRKLDALGSAPTLVDLAQAMESSRLSRADVDSYVHQNPHSYNRATVVANEDYELLVMTWQAGQSRVPHDHAGSICVMQVVDGEAVEGSYRVGSDGYVDLDYECTVGTGEITSGQDAGVHTVRNAEQDPAQHEKLLVTVHVYSPPLRDFRRFVARPQSQNRKSNAIVKTPPTIVVVGGGFSGAMTAAQVLRRAKRGGSTQIRVVLIERCGTVGEGLAYATRDPAHLLNVPADRMSAWPDRPDDFVRWASGQDEQVAPHDFLRRQWYGRYIRETLLETAQEADDSASFRVLFDEVRRIARRPAGGWMVHLATGTSFKADAVVLAIGHRPPSDPISKKWSGPRNRFIADPWRPFAMNAIKENEPVVILGSGLTAVDAVMSLADRGRPCVTLVSRNGLLPQVHAGRALAPLDLRPLISELTSESVGVRALTLLRKLRHTFRELSKTGVDWRRIFDGLRPHTATLWQAMSTAERRRFFKRLRPYWEIHRHRMAPAVGQRFHAMRDSGEVRTIAARVVSVHADSDRVRLILGERKTNRLIELDAAWVINCTGPAPSNSVASNPAIGSLLVHGLVCPDELGLGIETTADGNAIDSRGQEVPDLFVVGTLRKPAFWESTAVPELRQQSAVVGQSAFEWVARPTSLRARPNFVVLHWPATGGLRYAARVA